MIGNLGRGFYIVLCVAGRPTPEFFFVCINIFVFNLQGFGPTWYAHQDDFGKKAGLAHGTIQDTYLLIGPGRATVHVERSATNAIFIDIVGPPIPDFVKVVVGLVFVAVSVLTHFCPRFCPSME